MILQYFFRKRSKLIFVVMLAAIFFLSACAGKTETPDITVQPNLISPNESISTEVPAPTVTSSATPTLFPVESSAASSFGIIVFSMGDGAYSHLFVYNPYSLPMTRITANAWDDEQPALSPDGKKVAFTSNQGGQWDIYILDLSLDEIQRVTNTKDYDGSPAWSPDGQNIVYQTFNGKNLDLILQPLFDTSTAPIQITSDSGDNFDPAWSPDGNQIAFSTNRDGKNQIWIFDLKSTDDRFKVAAASDMADYINPKWSPDGKTLAWCKKDTEDHIEILSLVEDNPIPRQIGLGCSPAWSPDGTSILAVYQQPNSQYITAYNIENESLSFPLIQTQTQIQSISWTNASLAAYLLNYSNLQMLPAPTALFTITQSLAKTETGRYGVVQLKNVTAPNPYLSDTTDEAFKALRKAFGNKIGWDLLATLDNAYLPLTGSTFPGLVQSWLFSGRAIEINSNAFSANWMVATREDFNGKTYWRIWVKCKDQTGGCGEPILSHTWDFSARNAGELQAYEDGGKLDSIPNGYWVDFTEFAGRFGWERLPAQSDWRYYYPGTLYNQFVFREGLTWRQAMLQLYPSDAVDLLISGK